MTKTKKAVQPAIRFAPMNLEVQELVEKGLATEDGKRGILRSFRMMVMAKQVTIPVDIFLAMREGQRKIVAASR